MIARLILNRPVLLLVAIAALAFATFSLSAPLPKPSPEPRDRPDSEEAKPSVDLAKIGTDDKLRRKDAENRAASQNNLKSLAIAVHAYHDAYGRLPANIKDKNGKVLLSWRVRLLPYLEQENLYKQFKLDEPWDSKHNIKLVAQMPRIFQSPRVTLKRKGYTVYQAFSGPETVFNDGKAQYGILSITDGTSNTIFAVESTTTVPWSKPADIPFNSKKDLPNFGKAFGKQPLCAMFDGSTRVLDLNKIKTQTLKAAITHAGGEILGNDW
jgi:hypothetical protein